MRKLILLSSVFALSFGAFAQKEADAFGLGGLFGAATGIGQATEATLQNVLEKSEEVREETAERFTELYNELRLMSEQQTVSGAAGDAVLLGGMTSMQNANAIGMQQQLNADSAMSYVNAGGQNCVLGSGGKGTAAVNEGAEAATDELIEVRMRNINSEAGTDAENGLVDFQRRMFQRSTALCDPAGNGGANVFCTGEGNAQITLSTILYPHAFHVDNPVDEELNYMQDLLFSRIGVSVSPDLLEEPDTNAMNMVVEADRLKAEMSIGQSVFTLLQGNRTRIDSTVATSLAERLEAGGWSPDKIRKLTDGGVSKNSMYHALTVGSYSSELILQKTSANERDLLANIWGEVALSNVLQFEQYKLLEAIALATATNIVVNRDDAIKDLNARISNANSRN